MSEVPPATDVWSELVRIVAANQFMTLSTADARGTPWGSPVWFATLDRRAFYWVSSPDARHSRNLAVRSELAITIFDSRQVPYTSQGVYLAGTGGLVPSAEIEAGLAVYDAVSRERGLPPWVRADIEAPARHRLYRATIKEHFVLSSRDERIPADPR